MDRFIPHACMLRCASFYSQPCELINVAPSLNVNILIYLEAPLFSFILCDLKLSKVLLYIDSSIHLFSVDGDSMDFSRSTH